MLLALALANNPNPTIAQLRTLSPRHARGYGFLILLPTE
jgi:hypothetical protein